MKTALLTTWVSIVILIGISEAFSGEDVEGSQRKKDIEWIAKITGDSIAVVRQQYSMCDKGNATECINYLWKAEDRELNNLYAQVKDRVHTKFGDGSNAEKYLIKAQRAWITFRDATCQLETEGYDHAVPRQLENLDCLSEVTKKRNLELIDYLERVQ